MFIENVKTGVVNDYRVERNMSIRHNLSFDYIQTYLLKSMSIAFRYLQLSTNINMFSASQLW